MKISSHYQGGQNDHSGRYYSGIFKEIFILRKYCEMHRKHFFFLFRVTAPSAPIKIGITVTFILHFFFCYLARLMYILIFSLSFSFTLCSAGTVKSTIHLVFFFVDSQYVWSSDQHYVILLFFSIPGKFVRLSFKLGI